MAVIDSCVIGSSQTTAQLVFWFMVTQNGVPIVVRPESIAPRLADSSDGAACDAAMQPRELLQDHQSIGTNVLLDVSSDARTWIRLPSVYDGTSDPATCSRNVNKYHHM